MLKKLLEFNKYPARIAKALKKRLKLTITGVETTEKVIGLTFDDGPDSRYTPLILDLLDKYQAKATFFFVGVSAQRHPDIVKRVASSGHVIGNHTFNHPVLPMEKRKDRINQIRNTKKILEPYGSMLFRAPYGLLNWISYLEARVMGYRVVNWEVAAFDWLDYSAEKMYERINTRFRKGSIILMHDTLFEGNPEYKPRDNMLKMLEMFLEEYVGTYKFVTVPELLNIGKPQYSYGLKRKSDFEENLS